jgi:toxin ParE1/3/4
VSLAIEDAVNAYLDLHTWQRARKVCGRLMRASSHLKPRSAKRSPDGGADDPLDRQAIADIDHVYDFIAADNAAAARAMLERIDRAIDGLVAHPRMGRARRIAGSRELVVSGTPYIVVYRLRGQMIELLSVIHAARRWPNRL